MDYLLIGNSAAAAGAIEAIRAHDNAGTVAVVSAERHPIYSRPLISYLLGGMVDEQAMHYRKPDFYERNDVQCMLGRRAIQVDSEDRVVVLENDEQLAFERLLIATGGVPILPEIEGRELEGVFTFISWDDAHRIGSFIQYYDVKRAMVVGGGLIGLKSAEALLALGLETTIVELADRILSATFDQRASSLLEERLKATGTHIITQNTAARIQGKRGRVRGAILQDGERIDTDLLIFAIGVRPNIDLVADTGIEVHRGILVNERMETNVPGIYAAGDVAEALDLSIGAPRVIAIWPNAYRQGAVAGHNMVGVSKAYSGGLPMNSVELCGLPTISVGLTAPQGEGYEILQSYDETKPMYKKIVLKSNVIVGAISVGDIDRAGILTGLIQDRVDVSSFKDQLLDEDFGLISLPQAYRKHLVTGPEVTV